MRHLCGRATVVGGIMALAACGDGAAENHPPSAPTPSATQAAPAAAVVGSAGVRPEQREFQEWRAVCDNGNRCWAYSGSDVGGYLLVRMDAGPAARPQVLASMSATNSGVRLAIDGRQQALAAGPEGSGGLAVPPAEVATMLDRLAAAREIKLTIPDFEVTIPVAGASAALLWIDERQGRLGSTTALIRRGDRPADSVPAAPALPPVVAAQAVSQEGLTGAADPMEDGDTAGLALPAPIEALAAVKTCRAETDYNRDLQKAVLAARLGQGVELWGVPCASGAYNVSYLMFVTGANGADPRQADFPRWEARPESEALGDDFLTNPVYDPRTRTLSHFPRGRGLGDCGVIQSWTWTGKAFALNAEKAMGECWGMSSDLWPTTWRTR